MIDTPIDVSLVAGRRPELLERTLSSFHQHVLEHFELADAYVNIDPFGGDLAAHDACREIIKKRLT